MQDLKTQLLVSHFWFFQARASLVCTCRRMCLHVEYTHSCPGFGLTTVLMRVEHFRVAVRLEGDEELL